MYHSHGLLEKSTFVQRVITFVLLHVFLNLHVSAHEGWHLKCALDSNEEYQLVAHPYVANFKCTVAVP